MSLLNYDDIIKEGFVKIKKCFPSLGDIGIWKKHWACLRRVSSLGPPRIEIIKNKKGKYEEELLSLSYCIDLVRVLSVDILASETNALRITFLDNSTKVFISFSSSEEMKEWQNFIRMYSLMADNESVFHVFLLNNLALGFYGECILQVNESSLLLSKADEQRKNLISWPFVSLRRYNSDKNKFIFESGRSCKTGEGLFIFNTKEGEEICKKIKDASKELAQLRPYAVNTLPNPPLPLYPTRSESARNCRAQGSTTNTFHPPRP